MPSILEAKSAKEAINRLLAAIGKKEKTIIFGDWDLDGISAALILKESLASFGHEVSSMYFADRGKYGYGLSQKVVRTLLKHAPALLIVVDCGIGNIEGVKEAKRAGFDVLIVDHHEPFLVLPEADIIVDPKQPDDHSFLNNLCAAGLAYLLAKELFFEAGKEFFPESSLELAAIATLFDQMPVDEENRKIIDSGLFSLLQTKRVGLRALISVSKMENFIEQEVREKIIAPLSSGNSSGKDNEILSLLEEKSLSKAKKISKELFKKNKLKREKIDKIIEEIERTGDFSEPIIFEGNAGWPLVLAGVIASRLCHGYKKPVFIYCSGKKESQGSVRVHSGMNAVKMMSYCADLLINYGGHPPAAGFGFKNENAEKFKQCLIAHL